MAQFDVHRFRASASLIRHVVDVQSDFLSGLATHLVVPAYPIGRETKLIAKLNPEAEIDGRRHYLATQELAAIRVSSLGAVVGSLKSERDTIIAAIDLLVTGI